MRSGMRRENRARKRFGEERNERMGEEECGYSDARASYGNRAEEDTVYEDREYEEERLGCEDRGYEEERLGCEDRGYEEERFGCEDRGYAEERLTYEDRGYEDADLTSEDWEYEDERPIYEDRGDTDDDRVYAARRYDAYGDAYEDAYEDVYDDAYGEAGSYDDRESRDERRSGDRRRAAQRERDRYERSHRREKPAARKRGFRFGWLIPLALAAVCAVSSFQFFRQLWIYEQAKSEYAGLDSLMELWEPAAAAEQETEASAAEPSEKSPYPVLNIDYEALKSINSEFVGVLYLPVLGIKYPVAQATDNTKYLHTTFEGTSNASGCIFLDCAATPDFGDNNTFLFGHNMKNETMFGSLKDFLQDESLCDENPYIYIYQESQVLIYRIFAYYTISVQDDVYNDFSGEDGYDAYVADAITHSFYKLSDAANEEISWSERPRLLTLSTCYGTGHVYNFVVQAALVRTESPAAAAGT